MPSPALVSLLEAEAVPFATLHKRYEGLLELVRMLIGVVPNCDPHLEIWPPAFRTYNVMVPGFLNLPPFVWGLGAPKELVGLAMYASSRTAECMYCSAHTCSFALRRGTVPDKVAAAMGGDLSRYTPAERAAITVARSLSRVPATITREEREALEADLSAANVEWVVLSIAMMGFLNKTMDALGVALEPETMGEVTDLIAPSGWTPGNHADAAPVATAPPRADGLVTKLGVVRHAPNAIALDKKWTRGVPDRWPMVGDFLRERTGHDFPVVSRMKHGRAIRALATMLKENLDPATSVVGVPRKLTAALAFARHAGNAELEHELGKLGKAESDPAVDALARAIAPSPAVVDAAVVERCKTLAPAAIVEIVALVSVMQLVHRLEAFYAA